MRNCRCSAMARAYAPHFERGKLRQSSQRLSWPCGVENGAILQGMGALKPGNAARWWVVTVLWMWLLPSVAVAAQPEGEGAEPDISRALFADGRLWLLTDSGALSSIPDRGDKRLAEALPEPVLELCLQESSLLALTAPIKNAEQWTTAAALGAPGRASER